MINGGLEYPSRKNVLHCLKDFAAQSVNKELLPNFSKTSRIKKRVAGVGGGQGENKREGRGGRLFDYSGR